MRKYSLSALLAAGLLAGAAGSASAADLGGNCCADLEERIAELEATTARKGNRKVSLTVSGWVAQQVMWWDDGFESNVYVGDIGTTLNTNVKFTGQAQISPGWSAGYVIHLEAVGSETLVATNQDIATGNALLSGTPRGVQTLQSFWFLKSDTLGKLSVGLQSQASDNTAILVDGSGSLVPANFVQFDYGGFFVRGEGTGRADPASPNWITVTGCSDCNGIPLNSVRYDSPTFGGFSVSATWGEDDFWDIAARYAGEFSGFKLAVAAAYSESTDSINPFNQLANTNFFQIGGYIQHIPTGLFLYSAYGQLDDDDDNAVGSDLENQFWYIKAGIRTKMHPLGATVFYGEYEDFDNDRPIATANIDSSNVQLWGIGVVQEIDAAAMSLWLSYRHVSGDVDCVGPSTVCTAPDTDLEDFDYVKAGALINF